MQTKQIQLRVPGEIKDQITDAAKADDRSVNELITTILKRWLEGYHYTLVQPVDYEKPD